MMSGVYSGLDVAEGAVGMAGGAVGMAGGAAGSNPVKGTSSCSS